MREFTLITAGFVVLAMAGCAPAPAPITDDGVYHSKLSPATSPRPVARPSVKEPQAWRCQPLGPRSSDPACDDDRERPTSGGKPDYPDKPKGSKPKSDNSDANGKGGNDKDRDDKTKGGTEVAEEKK